MTYGESDLDLMKQAGCELCVHFAECRADALDEMGFSTLDLGKNCKGYEERKNNDKTDCR